MKEKKIWKEVSIFTKLASIGMLLSAILSLVIGFAIKDSLEETFAGLTRMIGDGILTAYIILFFVIDFIIAIGLFRISRWARRCTIWWGIFALINIIMTISNPSTWFVPNILTVISMILLFLGKKDFLKEE